MKYWRGTIKEPVQLSRLSPMTFFFFISKHFRFRWDIKEKHCISLINYYYSSFAVRFPRFDLWQWLFDKYYTEIPIRSSNFDLNVKGWRRNGTANELYYVYFVQRPLTFTSFHNTTTSLGGLESRLVMT